jgi:hypothetical protein
VHDNRGRDAWASAIVPAQPADPLDDPLRRASGASGDEDD